MKVTIDIDCTPEEARRFLGLPDLGPVHEAYIEQMRKLVADGLSADLAGEMIKSWAPMSEAGMAMWQQMMGQASGRK